MDIDRDELLDRIAEIEEEHHELTVTRDLLYLADEGLIAIDENGSCYPREDSCPSLP